jgi:hypothetical protein
LNSDGKLFRQIGQTFIGAKDSSTQTKAIRKYHTANTGILIPEFFWPSLFPSSDNEREAKTVVHCTPTGQIELGIGGYIGSPKVLWLKITGSNAAWLNVSAGLLKEGDRS